jgi:adenylate cyclase
VLDADDFQRLGLYDPDAEYAPQKLELLKYLTNLGATEDDLVASRDTLPGLAAVVGIRDGPALTFEEVVAGSGVAPEHLRRLLRATGFADPLPGQRVFIEGVVSLAVGLRSVQEVFGDEVMFQLARVLGSAMARVADAVISAFLVNVEPVARKEDPVGLAVARANTDAVGLLPLVAPALDILFRQHLLAQQRSVISDDEVLAGYETQLLVVGFVDLVGSTSLSQELSIGDWGQVVTTFETVAGDTVTERGGRVVKLIGDEVLYVVADPGVACAIALELRRVFASDPSVPPVRIGLASGRVLLRDGDVFGPVVALAARAVKVAAPGDVVASAEVVEAAGIRGQPLGPQSLKGFAGEVELFRVTDVTDG